jgi:fructokinase
VVTRGSDGAVAFSRNHTVAAPAQRVAVVDTVGAGDTVNAGILTALHEAGRLSKAGVEQLDADALAAMLDFAGRAAAVTVGRAGANPPWRHELG